MSLGKVVWYSQEKGYGLLQDHEVGVVFVHHSEVWGNGVQVLLPGQWITFDIVTIDKRRIATNVMPSDLAQGMLAASNGGAACQIG